MRENMALTLRKQPISSTYNMYHVILGQRIWSLDSHLAKPIADILCARYTEKTIIDLLRSGDRVLEAESESAKTHYETYLQSNRLVAVELDIDTGPDQGKSPSGKPPEHLDNPVCVSITSVARVWLTKQQVFDYWCIRGHSIEDTDVALVAFLGKESQEGVVMLSGRRFRMGNCLLPYVFNSLNKIVIFS